MRLAIDASKRCKSEDGKVSPKVGVVVVKDGQLLAVAYRGERALGDHAEFTAIETILGGEVLAGATVFTTLEPCTTRNHPKVGCALRLVERKVAHVFIGMLDPNPNICGRGVRLLRDHNIATDLFPLDLAAEVEDLNRDFTRYVKSQGAALQASGAGSPRSLNRQLYRLLFIITAQSRLRGRRLLLVTNSNLGWRVEAQRPEEAQPDTAYLLPYLEDANFDDRAAASDFAYAIGSDRAAFEVTIDPSVFRSTKYNPVFRCDTDYSFRFARVRLLRPVAALAVSRPELSLRPHQFEWHSLSFLMAHKPTRELNSDVLEELSRRFGEDLQKTFLSLETPVSVDADV